MENSEQKQAENGQNGKNHASPLGLHLLNPGLPGDFVLNEADFCKHLWLDLYEGAYRGQLNLSKIMRDRGDCDDCRASMLALLNRIMEWLEKSPPAGSIGIMAKSALFFFKQAVKKVQNGESQTP